MKQIRPFFISPLIFDEDIINARINSALINSLPDSFSPVALCGDIGSFNDHFHILAVRRSIIDRIRIKLLLTFTTKEVCYLPDTYYCYWYKKALHIAEDFLKKNTVDYLHSFSYPYSSHLVALELKKKYGIPWIAHFYEPWGDNPYRRYSNKVITRNSEWEDEVVRASDVIIHNSDLMCQSWRNKYGKIVSKKLFSLPMPFAFNKRNLVAPDKNPLSKLCITHIGNLYGLRKAEPFLRAIFALVEEKPYFRNLLKVVFVGEMLNSDVDFIKTHKLDDVIEYAGRKSEEECVEYYKQANIFLVIEGKDQGPLFFPSKLIQYYYYNKPIVGLTQENSVLWSELKSTGHKAYRPDDIDGIKAFLELALLNYNVLLNYNQNSWKRFDPQSVVDKYVGILDTTHLLNC